MVPDDSRRHRINGPINFADPGLATGYRALAPSNAKERPSRFVEKGLTSDFASHCGALTALPFRRLPLSPKFGGGRLLWIANQNRTARDL
jgi:hypothetical protein